MTRLALVAFAALIVAGCAQPAARPSEPTITSTPAVALASPSGLTSPTIESSPSASVVETAEASAPPTSPAPCPPSDRLRVAVLLAANPSCFGDRALIVIGWAAKPPIFGVLPPAIAPRWLWSWATTEFVVWDHSRGSESDLACSQGQCPPYFFLYSAPGTSIDLTGWKGWVRLSGHLNDPAAETCHYVYPPGWTETPFPDGDARAQCRSAFVVTAIATTSVP